MPYNKQSELPEAVQALPEHARAIYMAAFNAAFKQYEGDEEKAHATAWAAVKTKFHKAGDKWVAKSDDDGLVGRVLGTLGNLLRKWAEEPGIPGDALYAEDADLGDLAKSIDVPFVAKDEERRLVYGVVYEPHKLDSQGEWATPEEIEKAAHAFMRQYRRQAMTHRGEADGSIVPVESYIAPADLTLGGQPVAKGAWVLVSYVGQDDAWQAVKAGDVTGFSMLGKARRRERPLPGGGNG